MEYLTLKSLKELIKKAEENGLDENLGLFKNDNKGQIKPLASFPLEKTEIKKSTFQEYDRNSGSDFETFEYRNYGINSLEENEIKMEGIILDDYTK